MISGLFPWIAKSHNKEFNWHLLNTKLSNQNDDFILDDVDVDELNLYIEKITQITDSTEKLLSTISKLETENAQLKEEIDNWITILLDQFFNLIS